MKIRLGILCALVLFGATGCSTFRALFDEMPEETAAKQAKAKQAADAGEEWEDPVAKLLKPKRSKPAPLTVTSSLSAEEKALVESEMGLGVQARDEEKAVRDRMKRDSETYEDWVFGGNPLKNKER